MRKPNQTSSDRSKVRILFVDGDFAPGDLQELTQALTSAVRPTQVILRGAAPARLAAPAADGNGKGAGPDHPDIEVAEANVVEEPIDGHETPAARAAPRKRTYRKPVVLEVDLSAGEKSFEEFAKEKNPEGHLDRYLLAAAWFHDYSQTEAITVNHVYTCYKAMDWTFDVSDPTWPFRKLRSGGKGSTRSGTFEIGYQGLAAVKKMNSGS